MPSPDFEAKASDARPLTSALYFLAGVLLVLAPLLPGVRFSLSPVYSQDPWRVGVSIQYFESILPLLLPVLGVVVAILGAPESLANPTKRRDVSLIAAGLLCAALGAWSVGALYRAGQNGVRQLETVTFSRTMSTEFHVIAPAVPLVVGIGVAIAALRRRNWRSLGFVALAFSMFVGGVAGAALAVPQPSEQFLAKASSVVESRIREGDDETVVATDPQAADSQDSAALAGPTPEQAVGEFLREWNESDGWANPWQESVAAFLNAYESSGVSCRIAYPSDLASSLNGQLEVLITSSMGPWVWFIPALASPGFLQYDGGNFAGEAPLIPSSTLPCTESYGGLVLER